MPTARFLVVPRTFVLAVAACHLGRDVTPDRGLAPFAHGARNDALAFFGAVDGDAHGITCASEASSESISAQIAMNCSRVRCLFTFWTKRSSRPFDD